MRKLFGLEGYNIVPKHIRLLFYYWRSEFWVTPGFIKFTKLFFANFDKTCIQVYIHMSKIDKCRINNLHYFHKTVQLFFTSIKPFRFIFIDHYDQHLYNSWIVKHLEGVVIENRIHGLLLAAELIVTWTYWINWSSDLTNSTMFRTLNAWSFNSIIIFRILKVLTLNSIML